MHIEKIGGQLIRVYCGCDGQPFDGIKHSANFVKGDLCPKCHYYPWVYRGDIGKRDAKMELPLDFV